jgi:SAM-dependent methyltransferase
MCQEIMARPLFYNMWSAFHFLPRFKEISAEIIQSGSKSILDLGCGTGLFKKYYPACNYVGIDNNPRYIEYAKKNLSGTFILGDILELEKHLGSSRFDAVILNGVLHHLEDQSVKTLAEKAGEYLNPGGRIIIVDHIYNESLNVINRLLLKYDRGSFCRTKATFQTLFKVFNIASYEEFFINAGPIVFWVQCRIVLNIK